MACYRMSNSRTPFDTSGIDVPCPGNPDSREVSKCCARGSTCLGNNICYTQADIPVGGSGFYISSCTDATYQDDEACSPLCTDQDLPDIVYSYNSGLWQCCGTDENNIVACRTPTSNTFNAPPPDQLIAAASSSASSTASSITSTSSPTSSSIPTANALATASSERNQASESGNDSRISGGAIAGIVLGVVAGIALVAGLAFWLGRRRRRTRIALAHETTGVNLPLTTSPGHEPAFRQYWDGQRQELQ